MDSEQFRPAIKAFMNRALPGNAGGHALVVGENHKQTAHNRYLAEHFDALVQHHNLGALALETDPFMQAFFWAYRDGVLPAAPGQERALLGTLMRFAYGVEHHATSDSRAALYSKAIDRGLPIIPYDARHTLNEVYEERNSFGSWLMKRFDEHPNEALEILLSPDPEAFLMAKLRADFPSIDTQFPSREEQDALRNGVRFAYVMYELMALFADYPQYERWVQNADAVIEAGRRHGIGEDAVSAAIIKACAPEGKNLIVQAGHGHIIAPMRDRDIANQGTLHHHLDRAGLKTTTSILTDKKEWGFAGYGLRKGKFYGERMKEGGIPTYDVPPVLQVDADRVIDTRALSGMQRPFSIASQLQRARKAYEATPTPVPHVYGPAYIERMQERLDSPAMADALATLGASR